MESSAVVVGSDKSSLSYVSSGVHKVADFFESRPRDFTVASLFGAAALNALYHKDLEGSSLGTIGKAMSFYLPEAISYLDSNAEPFFDMFQGLYSGVCSNPDVALMSAGAVSGSGLGKKAAFGSFLVLAGLGALYVLDPDSRDIIETYVSDLIGGNSNTLEVASVVEGVEQTVDVTPVDVTHEVVSDPAAEYYSPNVYSQVTFEDSAFEKLHGGDISGYRQDYINDGGRSVSHDVSTTLLTENPNYLGQQFYYFEDVSNQLGPGAVMEFYTPVDDKVVMGAYAEALDKSRIPHVFASVTDSNGKIVYRGPWFSNNAADYSDAAQNGGLNSEIYRVSKELMLLDGVPKNYFDVVESKN